MVVAGIANFDAQGTEDEMSTITASFSNQSSAASACQALRDTYPGLAVSVQLSQKSVGEEGEQGVLPALRSLIVEIVGAQSPEAHEDSGGDCARLIVTGVDLLQLEGVEALLWKHHPTVINESTERAGHDGK